MGAGEFARVRGQILAGQNALDGLANRFWGLRRPQALSQAERLDASYRHVGLHVVRRDQLRYAGERKESIVPSAP